MNKIVYVYISFDEVIVDGFDFEVLDGINRVLWRFLVIFINRNNKKLVFIFNKFVVNEGENVLIILFEFCVED